MNLFKEIPFFNFFCYILGENLQVQIEEERLFLHSQSNAFYRENQSCQETAERIRIDRQRHAVYRENQTSQETAERIRKYINFYPSEFINSIDNRKFGTA